MAALTAVIGSIVAYGAALVTARSKISPGCKGSHREHRPCDQHHPRHGHRYRLPPDVLWAHPCRTPLPSSSSATWCTISPRPYLMMKNSLEKMNASWETTALLMGDNWMKTIFRIVTPNALPDHPGGVQLLLRERHGDSQRGHLHCRGQDHGHHHEDQGAAAFCQVQRDISCCPCASSSRT